MSGNNVILKKYLDPFKIIICDYKDIPIKRLYKSVYSVLYHLITHSCLLSSLVKIPFKIKEISRIVIKKAIYDNIRQLQVYIVGAIAIKLII